MVPQNKIKQILNDFLQEDGAKQLMDNCLLFDSCSYLNPQIKISIVQSEKNKILIEIRNNSHNGFTEYKKEYKI